MRFVMGRLYCHLSRPDVCRNIAARSGIGAAFVCFEGGLTDQLFIVIKLAHEERAAGNGEDRKSEVQHFDRGLEAGG